MTTHEPEAFERQSLPASTRRIPRWPFFSAIAALVLCVLSLGTVVTMQVTKTHDLRGRAREIRVGDDVLDVDARLGGAVYGYEYGRPSPGEPPTHQGAMYGGSIDNLHWELDALVGKLFRGHSSWYTNAFSKHFRDWPVVVEYDDNQRVTIVYIDGSPATSATQRHTQ